VFVEHIKRVVDNVEGGVGGVVMGLDGIAVDKYMAENTLDLSTIGIEFSYILGQAIRAGKTLHIGRIDEFSVKAERLTIVIRMLTDEYFLAVILGAGGNFGKCRYLMRLVCSRIAAELRP
jgi:predicted regulator of Ras-like GTPase activity (Roadblock/LC7/MglB family)